MKIAISWNDLIIEEGKLDPLGLWRVGDRLNDELLRPFTTVVLHRPARYFSMYSWIFYLLRKQDLKNNKLFWKRFFELESILICAIQLHHNHNYENFRGQIGSESAKKIIADSKQNLLQAQKVNNGWEVNYKMPMFEFNLLEVDFDSPNNLRLTHRGNNIAKAYEATIKHTEFYQSYLDKTVIPLEVIQELSLYSCPCLLFNAGTKNLIREREIIIHNMLKRITSTASEETSEENKLLSIYLILSCMRNLSKDNVQFNKEVWHRILSNEVYSVNTKYTKYFPPLEYKTTFQKWQLYNLDLLFVFALESGLSGFLQYLQEIGSDLKSNKLELSGNKIFHESIYQLKQEKFSKMFPLQDGLRKTMKSISSQSSEKLYAMEESLIEKIISSSSQLKIFYSFLLYLYLQTKYIEKATNNEYDKSLTFYQEGANIIKKGVRS